MEDPADGRRLTACPCCGRIQAVSPLPAGYRSRCLRCHTTLRRADGRPRRHQRTAALALGALLVYPVAITLPIMRIERFGQIHEASIWSGTADLLADGQLLVGLVVLLCSIVLPAAKLCALFVLTSGGSRLGHRFRARTWRLVEMSGRWGMLDVLLVALLVAILKLGDVVELSAGPAALAFTVCVLLNLAASASFDPHVLWENES
jgi:paraquat-inducible protein A